MIYILSFILHSVFISSQLGLESEMKRRLDNIADNILLRSNSSVRLVVVGWFVYYYYWQ